MHTVRFGIYAYISADGENSAADKEKDEEEDAEKVVTLRAVEGEENTVQEVAPANNGV